jgi:hypothetical protein
MSDLIIKISADIKSVSQAYDDVAAQSEDLESTLGNVAKISGVAFAALTAQIGVAVAAFAEADDANRQLSNSLQNQGVYTDALKDSYKEYADQVSATTGISTTQITQAQAVAQTYLGQIPITKQLTQAIADLAVKQGVSLTEAATEMSKAIGDGTGMLLRQGLQFSATDTEATRYQKTLDFVTRTAGGAATSISPIELATKKLTTAFEESNVELGQRFAPAITAVTDALTSFLAPAKDTTSSMVDFKAIAITLGVVIAGLGVALPLAAQGFLAVRAAVIALEIGAAPLVGIGVAIALLITGIVELALHWDTASKTIIQVVSGMVTFVSGAFKGLGTVISGAFHLDPSKIKEGLEEIEKAFTDGVNQASMSIPKATENALTEQDAVKKKFADKAAAERAQNEAVRMQLAKAERQAVQMENEGASAEAIALKKQEIETLKAMADKNNASELASLKTHLGQIRALEAQQAQQDAQQQAAFAQSDEAAREKLASEGIKFDADIDKKKLAAIRSTEMTEKQTQQKAYTDELAAQIKAHNEFLEEQNKYGTAYATINQIMHSTELQGTQNAFSNLTQLTQSSNATLKDIGKVATTAQIVISTAKSAMNIYAGFSTIPIVGPALGIAGAAAAVAFGAEQISKVGSAATGGIVGGTGFGDTQPYMLEPGELVTPRQNFNEVVNSVAASRNGQDQSSNSGTATVQLVLKDQLMDFIEAKLIQRKYLNISLQGSK